MDTTIYVIALVLIVGNSVFNFFADYLNDMSRSKPIPDNVKDVYDQENYHKWLKYSSEQSRLKFITGTIVFVFVFLMLVSGGFNNLADWTNRFTNNNMYLETLLFLGLLFAANFILMLPFRYYRTFSIEERYGFNRSTKTTFVRDQIMALILTVLFGGGIITLIVLFYDIAGPMFFVYTLVSIFIIFLFINITYTKIFVPLFNKLTPLEDGELKTRIETYAKSQNYEIKKVHVMDASRRSSKLNAFFSGFGRFKNVVLFDTLLKKMNNDEIIAVLAHEIGHAKHKDVLKNMISSMLTLAIYLGLFYGFIATPIFREAFNYDANVLHLGFMLLIFSLIISPIALFTSVFSHWLSRKAEFKADAFAAKTTEPKAMQSALKTLARENYSNLTPHTLYVWLHYSHPPINERVQAIDVIAHD